MPIQKIHSVLALISTAILCGLLCLSAPLLAKTNDLGELDRLVQQLSSKDPFTQQRAEVRIREQGEAALEPLLQHIQNASSELFTQLLHITEELIESRVLSLEADLKLRFAEEEEFNLLEEALKDPRREFSDAQKEEIRTRLKKIRESLAERLPRIQRTQRQYSKSFPLGARNLLRRKEFAAPSLQKKYLTLFNDFLPSLKNSLNPTSSRSKAFKDYAEGPAKILLYQVATPSDKALSIPSSLSQHFNDMIKDLGSKDFRIRRLAEDSFFIYGDLGLKFLRERWNREKPSPPQQVYLNLLTWRIHPRLAEVTGIDFSNYHKLKFRQKRQHIIEYGRTAGERAIPTLHRIVDENGPEKSIRVQVTAAEALAGLGDVTAIQDLQRRSTPELMKIPEISRDFFLLKGIQFVQEKKYALAVQEFRKVLDKSPFDFRANYRIAFAYLLMKDYEKSIEHFETARRLRPTDTLTLYNLSCAYSLSGKIPEALEALEASVKAGFDDASHIRKDPDLENLRKEQKYLDILKLLET